MSTVNLMIKRGELDLDPETDSSGARFIPRVSVERVRIAPEGTSRRGANESTTVALAEVVRFTGRSRTELTDLVSAGILEQVPGRRTCELTAASLQRWLSATA